VSASLDRCPQCGGTLGGTGALCFVCGGGLVAARGFGDVMPRPGGERPRFQPFVGWLLLLLGAAGLSYGGWRLLNGIASPSTASPTAVGTSEGAGLLWAIVLFFLLPGVVFAYAGVALLVRRSGDRDS